MLKEWFAISIKIPSIIIKFVDENFTIKRRMILMLSFVDVKALQSLSIIRNNVKLLDILVVTIEHKSHSTLNIN